MSFLVLCQPNVISKFKKKRDYAGGIYIRQPAQDFSFPITDIPKSIDTVYFQYDEGIFAYVMNNSRFLKHTKVFPFFINGDKITIGQYPMECLDVIDRIIREIDSEIK